MKDGKIFCFDIDGVVCKTQQGDYENAIPYLKRIKKINRLHNKHTIIFFTARGTITEIDWRKATEKQFKAWGLKYDKILFGKPFYDVFVDDSAISDKEFFPNGLA